MWEFDSVHEYKNVDRDRRQWHEHVYCRVRDESRGYKEKLDHIQFIVSSFPMNYSNWKKADTFIHGLL